jgi:hypothetical protein
MAGAAGERVSAQEEGEIKETALVRDPREIVYALPAGKRQLINRVSLVIT